MVCWGGLDGLPQQLGVPNLTTTHPNVVGEDASQFVPIDFGAGVQAKAIAMGFDHACIIRSDDKLQCWGGNLFGQLGYAGVGAVERCEEYTSHCISLPSAGHVPLFENTPHAGPVVQVGLGNRFTCALTAAGHVGCWGGTLLYAYFRLPHEESGNAKWRPLAKDLNFRRQKTLGREPDDLRNLTAVSFGNGSVLITQLAVGDIHSCALDTDGGVYCWGYMQFSAFKYLSLSSPSSSSSADTSGDAVSADDTGLGKFEKSDDDVVSAGGRTQREQLLSWPSGAGPLMVDMTGRTVVRIWANMLSTCAQLDSGDVRCWGDWARRFLGRDSGPKFGTVNGKRVHTAPFVPFAPSLQPLLQKKQTHIVTGINFACAAFEVGTVQCWGLNRACVLGQQGSSPCDSVNYLANDTDLVDAAVLQLALPTPSPSGTPSVSPSVSGTPEVSPAVTGSPSVSPAVTGSPSVTPAATGPTTASPSAPSTIAPSAIATSPGTPPPSPMVSTAASSTAGAVANMSPSPTVATSSAPAVTNASGPGAAQSPMAMPSAITSPSASALTSPSPTEGPLRGRQAAGAAQADTAESGELSAGAVAGIAVGAVAIVGIVGAVVYFTGALGGAGAAAAAGGASAGAAGSAGSSAAGAGVNSANASNAAKGRNIARVVPNAGAPAAVGAPV